MPSANQTEEDDPIVASYDVYITPSQTSTDGTNITSNLYILQYPAHRPSSKPYNESRSQKPTTLRSKPKTGIIEIDVPLFTNENYNASKGAQFGHALADTRPAHAASGYGLSGGFNNYSNPGAVRNANLQDIPQHDTHEANPLHTQTLGGKATTPTDRDPVYMLGSLRKSDGTLHLTHLDGVVQLRPQLHHLDARDELASRKAHQSTKPKQPLDPTLPVKLETKPIELKIKDTKEDARDRNLNANAKLLREIQSEAWKTHEWYDESDPISSEALAKLATGKNNSEGPPPAQLKSAIDNDEWLDRMSSPGIELRTRLKGRDRERARRKRQERLRLSKAELANTTTGGAAANASASTGATAAAASTATAGGQSMADSAHGTSDLAGKPGPFVEEDDDEDDDEDEDGISASESSSDEAADDHVKPEDEADSDDDDDFMIVEPTASATGAVSSQTPVNKRRGPPRKSQAGSTAGAITLD